MAQGFPQVAGLDFNETWASVVRIKSLWVLLSLAALFDLWIVHIDAKMAFMIPNGNSDVELYVRRFEGFVDRRYPNRVLRLRKSLYGLKQAPRICANRTPQFTFIRITNLKSVLQSISTIYLCLQYL